MALALEQQITLRHTLSQQQKLAQSLKITLRVQLLEHLWPRPWAW